MKVLYVDDEKINLLIFERIIGRSYSVVTADSGERGLELLDQEPDIERVVSDMRMPEMSGLDFIRIAKEQYHDKKYFILTGYAINDEIQEALDTGLIQQYFTKPANFNAITKALQQE